MRIVAASVCDGVVYHCSCTDTADPANPRLDVDAIIGDGDADGPLMVHVADYKRMVGFDVAGACLPQLRATGRTAVHDGVEYLVFPVWTPVGDLRP